MKPSKPTSRRNLLIPALALLLFPVATYAQFGEAWAEFTDPATSTVCGTINTPNFDLTVIDSTGEVVIVNGPDEVVPDLFVDIDNQVIFADSIIGDVVFSTDADGLPALFMIDLDGFVIDLDTVTLEPVLTDLLPENVGNTSCDACDFVDDDGGICGGIVGGGGGLFPGSIILCGNGGLFGLFGAALVPLITRRQRRRFRRAPRAERLRDNTGSAKHT